MVRRLVGERKGAHPAKRRVNLLPDPVGRQPEIQGAEGDVVEDGRHEELVVGVLEDDADLPADLLPGLLPERNLPDRHGPRRRKQVTVHVEEQRRLPRAVRADDADRLAVGDQERNSFQRLRAVRVPETDVPELEEVMAHPANPRTRRPIICGTGTNRHRAKKQPAASTKTASEGRNVSRRIEGTSPRKPRASIAP